MDAVERSILGGVDLMASKYRWLNASQDRVIEVSRLMIVPVHVQNGDVTPISESVSLNQEFVEWRAGGGVIDPHIPDPARPDFGQNTNIAPQALINFVRELREHMESPSPTPAENLAAIRRLERGMLYLIRQQYGPSL